MKKEFILQQTTIPEKKFNSQVLIGNWYEEKCDPSSKYSTFARENKFETDKYKRTTISQEPFIKSSQNWLNFQPPSRNQFETTHTREFKHPTEQVRNSVLLPFIVKKSKLEKDPQALNEYRQKWTKGTHFFDRTYVGTLQK